MTRDEAIERATNAVDNGDAVRFVDVLVELSLLNLDEPKSAADRGQDVFEAYLSKDAGFNLMELLDDAGLKIVEKDKP